MYNINYFDQVTLQPSDEDQGKPMGVDYCVRTYVADNEDDKSHKRSSVTLAIKKVLLRHQKILKY